MQTLKNKKNKIDELIKMNEMKTNELSSATKCIEDNIKSIFSEIRQRVNEREKTLTAQLDNISTKQSKALQDQMDHLRNKQTI